MNYIKKELLAEGAEAKIYLGEFNGREVIIKERIRKKYRHEKIDKNFRKYRTRREVKILKKLREIGIPVPEILYYDEKESIIIMEYIKGKKLSEILEKLDYISICKKIGNQVAKMHNENIIHNDLTTSNMIYSEGKIYFIDFGLSFVSSRIEDKATDIHLLKEALQSKHWKIFEEAFRAFLDGYSVVKDFNKIYKRFLDIEKRGRYK